jgi:CRP/FNR family transcriptional regulator, cyclic AMP receptor protein
MPDIDLSTVSFFSGFDQKHLDKIAAMGEPVEVEPNAVITEQGEVGQEAFVVVSGEVQVIVNGHPVATAGPGSMLGEMALIDLRPRSATLKALTPVELISYDAKHFRRILREMPDAERQALAERDERFREQNWEVAVDDDRPRPSGRG